jgi:uncharacterized protein (DUF1810 family)
VSARVGAIMNERFHLQRFVDAQDPVYDQVRRELRRRRKESHWMWFVFPQIAGLGQSAVSIHFAIGSLDEAKAYLAHPVLGPSLRECAEIVAGVEGRTAREVFGAIDEMKFRSSMTLFAEAGPDFPVFEQCLEKYFGGQPDPATLAALERAGNRP